MVEPVALARGVAILSAGLVVGFTGWGPLGDLYGPDVRPVWLQLAAGAGLVFVLILPERILVGSTARFWRTLCIMAVLAAMAANPINWEGLIAPVVAILLMRNRLRLKERIEAMARCRIPLAAAVKGDQR